MKCRLPLFSDSSGTFFIVIVANVLCNSIGKNLRGGKFKYGWSYRFEPYLKS